MQGPSEMPASVRWVVYLVHTIGFPVVVAGYLLWQVNATLGQVRDALLANTAALSTLIRLHGG